MEILNEATMKLGSDAAVAKALGVHPSFVSQWRMGHRPIPAHEAALLGEIVGRDPLKSLAETMARGSKREKERRNWEKWAKSALTAGLSIVVILASGWIFLSESKGYKCNLMSAGFNYRSLLSRILSRYFQVFAY